MIVIETNSERDKRFFDEIVGNCFSIKRSNDRSNERTIRSNRQSNENICDKWKDVFKYFHDIPMIFALSDSFRRLLPKSPERSQE